MLNKRYNAKELDQELYDYRERLRFGGLADFQGKWEIIAKKAREYEGKYPLINFLGVLGAHDCMTTCSYWKFSEQIQTYQVKFNVSSVIFQTVEWDGKIIRYPECATQLITMPQDKQIVMRYKDKIVNWFTDFAEVYAEQEGYEILTETEEEIWEPITLEDISNLSREFEWATLTPHHSPKVTPVYSGNNREIAYWRREFCLFLNRGDHFWADNNESVLISLYKRWDVDPESECNTKAENLAV